MKRMRGRRPSPAMVVAILALLVAIGGTAVAGTALTKREKKQATNIAKTQITRLAPGLSVANAKTAENATRVGGSSLAQIAPGELGFLATCSLSTSFQTCGTFNLTLDRTADVVVVATAQWYSPDAAGTSVRGRCAVRRDTTASNNVDFGSTAHDTDSNQPRTYALTHVFGGVPAGTWAFDLRCIEDENNIELANVRMVGIVATSS